MDKEQPSKATVDRLYSFYHRNSLSTPLALAYGLKPRVEKKVAKKGGDAVVRTARGDIPVKRYVVSVRKQVDILTKAEINREMKLNKYLHWSDKVQDILTIPFGITASESTYSDAMDKLTKFIEETVRPTVRRFVRTRRPIYAFGEHLIGARCWFVTSPLVTTSNTDTGNITSGDEVTVDNFHTTVSYVSIDRKEWLRFFIDGLNSQGRYKQGVGLYEALKRGFEVVFNYKSSTVTIKSVSFVVITRESASGMERLRGRK